MSARGWAEDNIEWHMGQLVRTGKRMSGPSLHGPLWWGDKKKLAAATATISGQGENFKKNLSQRIERE